MAHKRVFVPAHAIHPPGVCSKSRKLPFAPTGRGACRRLGSGVAALAVRSAAANFHLDQAKDDGES